MNRLQRFYTTLKRFISKSCIGPQTLLTRFILSKQAYKKDRVLPGAFTIKESETEISVFRIDGLSDNVIWEIGKNYIIPRRPDRHIHARADLEALAIMELGLKIRPDNNPARHTLITNLPKEKYERQEIAIKLSEASRLILPSPPLK
ncbi:MAG: hypothetical protein WC562_09510 [Dehalococcoidia bacterium]